MCNANCKTCGTNDTNCLTCGFSGIGAELYLYQSPCLLTCPVGYFANTVNNTCDPCANGCGVCTGASLSNCSVCVTYNLTPYYKYQTQTICDTSCPDGELISGTTPNACEFCDPGCLTCVGTSTNCTINACQAGDFYYAVNSSCLRTCPDNYYANSTQQECIQCIGGCELCYGGLLTNCTKCQVSGVTSYYKIIDIDECTVDCPAGQYEYGLLLACQYCHASCLTCNTSATDCQTCTNVSGVPYFNH